MTLTLMAIQLEVVDGPDKGQRFLLPPDGAAVIGRGRSAQVRLTDLQVSREQCRLHSAADGLILTDTSSTGGTAVNGQRITEHVLRLGDVIDIGQTRLRVQESDVADLTTLPPIPPTRQQAPAPADTAPPAALPTDPSEQLSPAPVASFVTLPPERLGELAGQTFWHYRLGDVLARGQSGLVFRGTDTRNEQPVALKVLWPQ